MNTTFTKRQIEILTILKSEFEQFGNGRDWMPIMGYSEFRWDEISTLSEICDYVRENPAPKGNPMYCVESHDLHKSILDFDPSEYSPRQEWLLWEHEQDVWIENSQDPDRRSNTPDFMPQYFWGTFPSFEDANDEYKNIKGDRNGFYVEVTNGNHQFIRGQVPDHPFVPEYHPDPDPVTGEWVPQADGSWKFISGQGTEQNNPSVFLKKIRDLNEWMNPDMKFRLWVSSSREPNEWTVNYYSQDFPKISSKLKQGRFLSQRYGTQWFIERCSDGLIIAQNFKSL